MNQTTVDRVSAYFDAPLIRERLVAAVSRLVRIKSVRGEAAAGAPFGSGPRAALDEALRLCGEMGFSVRDYDHYVGLCDLNDRETQLHILGHLDVVGEGKGWDTDPYVCVEKDGLLYGRGVSDDKGPVCAALFALKAVRDLELPVSKNVRLILGTDEESGSEDIAYYYAREPYAHQAFTPDADFPLIHIEKGRYHPVFGRDWTETAVLPRVSTLTGGFRTNVVPPEAEAVILGATVDELRPLCRAVEEKSGVRFSLTPLSECVRVHCVGRNAHAASPDDGVNAISALLETLAALPLADCDSARAIRAMANLFPFGDTRGKALGIAQADAESGELTLNLALMTLTETGFTAQFDARVPICATGETCAERCERNLGRYGIHILEYPDMAPAHVVEADSPLVKTLLECYSACTGVKTPKPVAIGGGTYVHDIPGGVAFGCGFPGFDSRMHSPNERVSVEHLMLSAKIFTLAIAELCR